jgi:succinyl-CoA synthetase beta subunit
MNIHEYQAKKLLDGYGIPIPMGMPAFSATEALQHAEQLGGSAWMVKAQVHAGGRGKAGGIKKAMTLSEVSSLAAQLLGSQLITHQSSAGGQRVNAVLIETPAQIARELYLSIVVDRRHERVNIIASPAGGMDIEKVAATQAHKIFTTVIDPAAGLQAYQARTLGFNLDLDATQVKLFNQLLDRAWRLFMEKDLSLLEINPLIVTTSGEIMALDAKITLDDNALFRHPDLAALYDPTQSDAKEDQARQFDLNYIALDGDIACMVNGAGLAMATMDIIKLHGGQPANFLDVGGGTTAAKVTEAFKLILSDRKVKAILVNIFGGIVRCDLIAEGIIQAVRQTELHLPVVVRLEGTNVTQGKQLLADSGLNLISANNLSEAARKVVAAAQGA